MKTISIIVAVFFTFVIGLTVYLGPNDLRSCSDSAGPDNKSGCGSAGAIVALSGGDTTARTRQAIQLYHAGWASKLIFSGAAKDKTGPSNAAAMRTQALSEGVPDSDIIVEERGQTTRDNAERTQKILAEHAITSVILVTSGYHQRRAELELKKSVGNTVTIRNHPDSDDRQWSAVWWLTPGGWWLAGGEIIKIIAFYTGSTT